MKPIVVLAALSIATAGAAQTVAPATGVTIAASLPSPQREGAAVTFTAAGQGSSGYQYRFWLWTGGVPALVQDWSVAGTWTLPATTAAGSYVVQADVRTSSVVFAQPIARRDAYVKLAYVVAPPAATGVALTSDLASPQRAGAAVTFTAAGQGSAGYQYRFWLWTGGVPTLVQNWSATATWTLPATTAAGSYVVQADVRTSSAIFAQPVAARDAFTKLSYVIAPPAATGVTLTSDKASPQIAGAPIVFTAAGLGSSGYQYRFWLWTGGVPALVQNWSASATWTMPATMAPGSYTVQADVRTSSVMFAQPVASRDAFTKLPYVIAPVPVPAIAAIAPTSGSPAGGDVVTITGTNFDLAAAVSFGGVLGTVTAATATSLTVTTPAHAAGAVDVVVANPSGQTATSVGAFTYTAPAITVATITPATGSTAGGDVITITGTGFDPAVTVDFGGFFLGTVTAATATSITVTTPPHPIGAVDLIITNPNNQSFVVLGGFTFTAPVLVPKITGITPATDTANGGSTVTITGVDFGPGAVASFGGVAGTSLGVSAKSMLVVVPAHLPGLVDVTVTNLDGSTATLAGGFIYTAIPATTPAPTLTSVLPGSGPIAGGSVIAVNGTNFVAGTSVLFGGVPGVVQSFTATSIAVATPAASAAGFVDVTVVNPDLQKATLVGAFRYTAPGPNILTLNIHGSPMAGGTLVLIAGTGFQVGATVTFGGVPGLNPVYDPVNKVLQVTTPPGPGGAEAFVSVVVTNPDGQSAGILGFHYGPPPVGTDFFVVKDGSKTLNNGKAGQLIDIVGSQFSTQAGRGVQVLFAGPAAGLGTVDLTASTPTLITVGIPKLNPGSYQVFVTNFDGQFTQVPGTLIVLGP